MRTHGRRKVQKNAYVHPRINKKKYKKRSKEYYWSWKDDNISGQFLNNINEVLRENKARRAEGKGSWKVMPRDSCEVYKDRRKRETNRRKQKNREDSSNDANETREMDVDRKVKRKYRQKQKKRMSAKKYIEKSKYRKRSRRSSPSSLSYTITSTGSRSTTCSTVSEMDYD